MLGLDKRQLEMFTRPTTQWTELFSASESHNAVRGARIIPGNHIAMSVRPMMHYRPASIAISTNRNARLECELMVMNRCFPLGYCDLWKRNRTQKLTAFVHTIDECPIIGPANCVELRLVNRGKFDVYVLAQLDGQTVNK